MEQVSRIRLVESERSQEPVSLVIPGMAQRLVQYGLSMGWNFEILPYRGTLDTAVGNSEWTYEPYTDQELHPEAEQRLWAVWSQPWVHIAQVVYGHEVEKPDEYYWDLIRKRATSFLSAVRAAAEAVGEAIAEIDPCVCVVLSDENRHGEIEYTWVLLCRWL